VDIDWNQVARGVGKAVEEGVLPYLEESFRAAAADLKTWASVIGRDLVNAVRKNELEWKDELLAQARVLAEIMQVRAGETAWEGVMRALKITFAVLKAVLL